MNRLPIICTTSQPWHFVIHWIYLLSKIQTKSYLSTFRSDWVSISFHTAGTKYPVYHKHKHKIDGFNPLLEIYIGMTFLITVQRHHYARPPKYPIQVSFPLRILILIPRIWLQISTTYLRWHFMLLLSSCLSYLIGRRDPAWSRLQNQPFRLFPQYKFLFLHTRLVPTLNG